MQSIRVRRDSSADAEWSQGMIVDFTPEREIIAHLPSVGDDDDAEAGDGFAFAVGDDIEVEVPLPDGIRRFASRVESRTAAYGGSLRLTWPVDGVRLQRRDHVRVGLESRATVRFVDPKSSELRRLEGPGLDLSAGGLRVRLPERLPAELRVEVELDIPKLRDRSIQGRVVRSTAGKRRGGAEVHTVAIEFVGVIESVRKMITHHVFEVEREQRRQRLP